jgi:hypothetical protein
MLSALKRARYNKFKICVTLTQLTFIFLNSENTGPYSILVSLLIVYAKGEDELSVVRRFLIP